MELVPGPSTCSSSAGSTYRASAGAAHRTRRTKSRFTKQNETNGRASPQIRRRLIVCAYPEAVSPDAQTPIGA